jgi:hypothetical protein
MRDDIGEELVGAYLTEIEECDHVLYNVRAPGGGQRGLRELDVIGLKFSNDRAYLCEVTTHLEGLLIGKGYDSTIKKIREKHEWQVEYAQKQLRAFTPVYQFWSPRVPEGALLQGLKQIPGLRLVVNSDYTKRVDELRARARQHKPSPTSNMAYRLIQILEHLKRQRDDPQSSG